MRLLVLFTGNADRSSTPLVDYKLRWYSSTEVQTYFVIFLKYCLTLNLLTTTRFAPPSNARKWQMGLNSAFKGLIPMGWDVSVGIATLYGLDSPGIDSRWGRDFPHPSRPALGPNQLPIEWVPALSRG